VESDLIFLAEMALYGKIVGLPDRLFRRRFHEEASSAMTPTGRQEFVYGEKKSSLAGLKHWHHIAAYYWAVTRAPVPMAQRLELYRALAKTLRGWRRVMRAEARSTLGFSPD
jgi:hypothetical protein